MSAALEQPDPRDLRIALTDDVRKAVRIQRYLDGPEIEGVRDVRLGKSHGEEGWFAELFRLDSEGIVEPIDGEAKWSLRQLSASRAEPGRVNAFHIHAKRGQNEYWTVVEGELLVCLVDCRIGSSTSGTRRRLLLSGEAPVRLTIPAGVAHGYRAGTRGGLLVYGMDRQFDRDDPDEGRLPWNFFGSDLWERDTG